MLSAARVCTPLRASSRIIIAARAYSAPASGHGHEEHHDHHEDHHHHGPELGPAESPFNSTVLFIVASSVGILGTYAANSAWEKKTSKTILQSLMGAENSAKDISEGTQQYRERVTSLQSLFQLLQFNQPERTFHEFATSNIVPTGSYRSLVPGTFLKKEEIGPRRERTQFFKDL